MNWRSIALSVVSALMVATAAASDPSGQASVIDGDTLEMHGKRIRLWGIDAPESSQLCRGDDSLPYRCGAEAANALDGFIDRRPVECFPVDIDRYGRTVARCSAGGIDLGQWMVAHGRALDWPLYSHAHYRRPAGGGRRRPRHVERQLRGAVALQGLHQRWWQAGRLFG